MGTLILFITFLVITQVAAKMTGAFSEQDVNDENIKVNMLL